MRHLPTQDRFYSFPRRPTGGSTHPCSAFSPKKSPFPSVLISFSSIESGDRMVTFT